VVIPTWNRRELVGRAVRSALARTGESDEVIVVDDGSTDGTAEDFDPLLPRVRFLRRENGGPSAARNQAVCEARGRFVALLDSDDEWLPVGLDAQVGALEVNPELGFSFAGVRRTEADGTVVETPPADPADPLRRLLERNYVPSSTLVIRKEAMDAIGGFDEELPVAEDWDLVLRLAERHGVHRHDEIVLEYHAHEGQLSRDQIRMDEAKRTVLARAVERLAADRPDLARHAEGRLAYRTLRLGKRLLTACRRDEARACFRAAARLRPRLWLTALRYRLLGNG